MPHTGEWGWLVGHADVGVQLDRRWHTKVECDPMGGELAVGLHWSGSELLCPVLYSDEGLVQWMVRASLMW